MINDKNKKSRNHLSNVICRGVTVVLKPDKEIAPVCKFTLTVITSTGILAFGGQIHSFLPFNCCGLGLRVSCVCKKCSFVMVKIKV